MFGELDFQQVKFKIMLNIWDFSSEWGSLQSGFL